MIPHRAGLALAAAGLILLSGGHAAGADSQPVQWSKLEKVEVAQTPIRLVVADRSERPFYDAWHANGTWDGRRGYLLDEVRFTIGPVYGRIRATVTPTSLGWSGVNNGNASAVIKTWPYLDLHQPELGKSGAVDHGRIEFSFIRFRITVDGSVRGCFGYVGFKERWLINGWTCGAAADQFDNRRDIETFIRAIGVPNILTPQPINLPGKVITDIAELQPPK